MIIKFPCVVLECFEPKKKGGHGKIIVEVPAEIDPELKMKISDPTPLPLFAIGEHYNVLKMAGPGELLDVTAQVVSRLVKENVYNQLFYVKSIKLYQ